MTEKIKVAVFRPYKFNIGQRILLKSGPRKGDWEVVGISESKVKLRCPISSRDFEWDRFCYFVEERDDIKWPTTD